MKSKLIAAFMLALSGSFFAPSSKACTNVIVTKGASSDGSVFVSYAADSHGLFGELYFHPAATFKAGQKLKVYEWDTHRYLGEIEQVENTYQTVGNMNEHQLIITETTFGGREELADPNGKIDYGSLIYITLQRASSAREAIKVMANLVDKYGYYSEGETFSIADKDEAWIMEMVGKGDSRGQESQRGAVWVALRVPDGYICCHANQSRITTFPLDDPDNCLYSRDVISFARSRGYYQGPDDKFSFRDAYCPDDFGGLRACEARVWSAYNILGNGKFRYDDIDGTPREQDALHYVEYALGHDPSLRMPLFIKPGFQIDLKDVADVMRDHYEGTPLDMRNDIGAGGNALPYRWRPMRFSYDGRTFINERAIATQQTGFWLVGQARSKYPDVVGGILWFGTDDAATSYVTPIYTSTTRVPQCFKEGNGDILTYSPTSSFWINNRIANSCYRMYNQMEPYVRKRIDDFENEQMAQIQKTDAEAMKIYNKINSKPVKDAAADYDPATDTGKRFAAVKRHLTTYSNNTAQTQFKAWKELEITLLVKFIDGNVKAEDNQGRFIRSDFSPRMAGKILHPEYTETWKKAVAESHGDVLEVTEWK